MKVKLLQDYDWNGNDEKYTKGQIIEVEEIDMFPTVYVRFFENLNNHLLDWMPRDICEPIK